MKTKIFKTQSSQTYPHRSVISSLFVSQVKHRSGKMYISNVDWQMNMPLNSNFADKFSGWGMNFEGKYDLTPYWSIGAFLNFHTNHRYVDRQTIPSPQRLH